MVPAPNATSAPRITTQCVHQELDIAWRLNPSHFVFNIFIKKMSALPSFIILTSADPKEKCSLSAVCSSIDHLLG